MSKCKTCGKQYYNPYIKTDYCSSKCENSSNNKEDDVVNKLKNMFGINK